MPTIEPSSPAIKQSSKIFPQGANDVLAVFCVVAFVVWNANSNMMMIAQLAFFGLTSVNAYLENRKFSVICVWAVFFYGYCILSQFWAYSVSAAVLFRTTIIKIALLVIFVSLYAQTRREINILLKSVVAGVAVVTVLLLINTPLEQWGGERLGANIGMNQNRVGALYVYGVTICVYYTRKKNLYLPVSIVFAIVLMFTGSRRAFVVMLLVLFLFYLSKLKRPSDLLYTIPVGALLFLLIYLSINNPLLYNVLGRRMEGLLNLLSGEGKVDSSTLKRMELINTGLEQFRNNMLIGYGLNNFVEMNRYSLYSHNNYIELLVNFGLIGAVLYYSMPIVTLFKSLSVWFRKSKEEILPILLIIIVLVSDYGTVSYYSPLTLILLTIAYRLTELSDIRLIEKPEQAVV